MEVFVYGLGYVGTVTALSLCRLGLDIHGVESVPEKVSTLEQGKLHLYEPDLEDLLKEAQKQKKFKVTTDSPEFSKEQAVFVLCVGTPQGADGSVDLSQAKKVLEDICKHVNESSLKESLFVMRSTVPPGSCENTFIPFLKNSLKNKSWDFVYFPEFLREGTAVEDFQSPKVNVLAGNSSIQSKWSEFFEKLPQGERTIWSTFKSAEMLKYAMNSYNALRVAFSNEMASLGASQEVDVTELFQNLQSLVSLEKEGTYLNPGFCYGGPCLTKELKASQFLGRKKGVETPLLKAVEASNEEHFKRFFHEIEKTNFQNILFSGVTFKPNTDDLRDSWLLKAVKYLVHQPLYQEEKKITIVDHQASLKRLESRFMPKDPVVLKTSEKLKSEEFDLIVLGTFPLPEKTIESLCHSETVILNLNFFSLGEALLKHERTLYRGSHE